MSGIFFSKKRNGFQLIVVLAARKEVKGMEQIETIATSQSKDEWLNFP